MQSSQGKRSILDYILHHCRTSPTTEAIVSAGKTMTYECLSREISKVSNYIQNRGIESGSVIGIMQNDISSALASLLGCLHAGCIYCPIDPTMTPEKIHRTLTIANIELVLSEPELPYERQQQDPEFVNFGDLLKANPENLIIQKYNPLAYIMFTSGSTGDPKGVAIGHDNLIETYEGWSEIYRLSTIKKHLQFASLSFDVFAGDWIRGLCSGATIYAPTPIEKNCAKSLASFISTHKIECAEFTPIILRELYTYALNSKTSLRSFKLLIAGSDVMRVREFKDIRKILTDDCRLIFSYGTTETTIDSTYFEPSHEVLNSLPNDSPLPIGIPFPNALIEILNGDGTRSNHHEVGELYIGGGGVGQGYLHHDTRTAGRYLRRLPLGRHGRWYRTGDLASYNGKHFSLHGRADARIKIHGKLVDLTDLESHLRDHEEVLECVATTVPHDIDRKILVLIKLTSQCTTPNQNSIKQHISHLDDYPILSTDIHFIKRLPMTLSGKIDRSKASKIAIDLQAGASK